MNFVISMMSSDNEVDTITMGAAKEMFTVEKPEGQYKLNLKN
jgi:hypothetical protein